MDNANDRNIEQLAKDFLNLWHKTQLPMMDAADMLDLVDYFTDKGMDFEADLCFYIANQNYPDDPEVMLAQAHNMAELGNWRDAKQKCNEAGVTGYDEQIFSVEKMLRSFQYDQAFSIVKDALPSLGHYELPDNDFIFDAARLFYDNGYNELSIQLFSLLPSDYVDYQSAQLHIADALSSLCRYDEAKTVLNRLLDADSFNAELWEHMANVNFLAGNYDEATEASRYATDINPDSSANRYPNMITTRQRATTDETGALFGELTANQECSLLKEYADTLYGKGAYNQACNIYAWSALFCPNGDNLRIYLQRQYVLCLAHEGKSELAYTLLQSLTTFYGDYWDIIYEAAQLAFENGQAEWAIKFLKLANDRNYLHDTRLNQLVMLLTHYDCYVQSAHLWKIIFSKKALLSPSFRHYVDVAIKKLENGI